jgi:hypothetical protein
VDEPESHPDADEPDPESPSDLAIRVSRLERNDVLPVGWIASSISQQWPDSTTRRLVIIGERYTHIIERHPEMSGSEASIIRALQDPDEVQRNKVDSRMALYYRAQSTGFWLRLAVWISDRTDRENSLLSARLAKQNEVEAGREAGRRIWRKG